MVNKGSVNKVILIGNMGRDPDSRISQSGTNVTNIVVATSAYDKSAENNERTEWTRCVAFGKTADFLSQYASKGSRVYVEGSLRTSSYEKNGETRYSTEVVIENATLIGAKNDNGGGGQAQSRPAPGAQTKVADDDIPF